MKNQKKIRKFYRLAAISSQPEQEVSFPHCLLKADG
jgi:hypothetical protein